MARAEVPTQPIVRGWSRTTPSSTRVTERPMNLLSAADAATKSGGEGLGANESDAGSRQDCTHALPAPVASYEESAPLRALQRRIDEARQRTRPAQQGPNRDRGESARSLRTKQRPCFQGLLARPRRIRTSDLRFRTSAHLPPLERYVAGRLGTRRDQPPGGPQFAEHPRPPRENEQQRGPRGCVWRTQERRSA